MNCTLARNLKSRIPNPKSEVSLWVAAGLVALCALAVYLRTLSPSITWAHDGADSGDFAAAVACGGVPHPTGYPTYLLLASLWALLPWGDVAFRLNLLSASMGAFGAGLMVVLAAVAFSVGRGQRRRSVPTVAAACAGLLLAFGPLVWSQAVIAEVYTLHLAFVVGLMLVGASAEASLSSTRGEENGWQGKRGWRVALTFGLLGVGLGNHLSLALTLPALLVLLWGELRARPGWFFLSAVLGLVLGLSVYALIPLRAAQWPPVNWGGASTAEGLWWLVSGQAYRGLVLGLPLAHLPARVAVALRLLVIGVGGWGLPFAVVGAIGLWERRRRLAVATLLVFVLYGMYAVWYDTTDSYVYLLPAAAMATLWTACGLYAAIEWLAQGAVRFPVGLPEHNEESHRVSSPAPFGALRLRYGVCVGALALSLVGLPWHWAAMDLSENRQAIDYAVDALRSIPHGSLIVVRSDAHTFALWYGRYGLKLGENVAVVNDALLQFEWYRAILRRHHPEVLGNGQVADLEALLEANTGVRPVYFGDRPEELGVGEAATPFGPLWEWSPVL